MISRVSRLTLLICSMERSPATSEARRIGELNQKDGPPTEVSCQETTDSRPNGGSDSCNQGPHSIMRPILRLGPALNDIKHQRKGKTNPHSLDQSTQDHKAKTWS